MIRCILCIAGLSAAMSGPPAVAQQTQPSEEIVLVVTALSPESSITLGSEPATVGSTAGLYPGEPLTVEVKGGVQDMRESMFRIDALGASVLTVRATIDLEVDDKRGLTIRPQLGTDGSIDV